MTRSIDSDSDSKRAKVPLGERLLKSTEDSISDLMFMITSLLDLEKMLSGKILVSKELVDLSKIVKDALQTVTQLASERNITVATSDVDSVSEMWADEQRLVQSLNAILRHFLDTIPEQSTICLRAEQKGNFNTLTVETPAVDSAPLANQRSARQHLVEDLSNAIAKQHGGSLTIIQTEFQRSYALQLPS